MVIYPALSCWQPVLFFPNLFSNALLSKGVPEESVSSPLHGHTFSVSVMRKVWYGVGCSREARWQQSRRPAFLCFVSVYFPICHYYHLFLRLFPASADPRTRGPVFEHASMKCTYLVSLPQTSLSPWHIPRVSPFALFPNLANTRFDHGCL